MKSQAWFPLLTLLSLTLLHVRSDQPAVQSQDVTSIDRPAIQVPPGFVVEIVAKPPLVKYPMMACFDERGRLFISESDGQNLGKAELTRQKPRFVRVLEPADRHGKFQKGSVFADKMIMPQGALWHKNALYIVSAPYLWRLEDTDGDGQADKRQMLVGEMDFIGNANQSGPYLAPDGRLFFTGGTFGYDLVGKDGKKAGKGNWAGVFSCRDDGTDVRIECHAGINPVEIEFTPEGEAIGNCAIFDRVGGRHDALVHWIHGGSYAERLRQPNLKQTGRYLPAVSRWGQVAPSGLMRYRGTQFGKAYRDTYFVCHYNTHKVVRVRLERTGATFHAQYEDFLVCPDPDFHPADILEDADGSLLLLDTGGWLTMGCPSSKHGRQEVFGAIYRIRKTGADQPADPWGLRIDWAVATPAQKVEWLDDPRPMVRDRALASLAGQSSDNVVALSTALRSSTSARVRQNAVWALARIGTQSAGETLSHALADADAGVCQAAVHALGTLRERSTIPPATLRQLHTLVIKGPLPIRRQAATTLGLLGKPESIPSLLESLQSATDEFLEHALIYALIEINHPAPVRAGLSHPSPRVRRGALIALDQMPAGELTRELVTALLDANDPDLHRAALDVILKQRWSGELIGLLTQWLRDPSPDVQRQAMIRGAILAFPQDDKVQTVVADALRDMPSEAKVLLLLEAIGRSGIKALPASWSEALTSLAKTGNTRVRRQVVSAVTALDSQQLDATLLLLAADTSLPEDLRVAALVVPARHGARLGDDAFRLLTQHIGPDKGPIERLAAAAALGSARLSEKQLLQLPDAIKRAGPLEVGVLLRAFESAAHQELSDEANGKIGFRLVESLGKSAGLYSLSAARVEKLLARYPPEVRQAGQALSPRLRGDSKQQLALLADLGPKVASGNAEQGKHIFFGNRASCGACHKIGASGGDVGPDLSRIGQIRTTRDLLEAILFPSATITNGFETYVVTLRSGRSHTGLMRRESQDAIYLMTTERAEIRVPRAEVEEMAPTHESIMPQGLDKNMSVEELSDVLAYLRMQK